MLLFVACSALSCSKSLSPFTEQLRTINNWNDRDLKKIQFYNSDDILLTRELSKADTDIVKGKIVMENGVRLEQVLIEKGTPGVAVFSPKKDRIAVSFESDDDLYLMWGPNPKFRDQYMLMFKERNRRSARVTYGTKVYNLRSNPAVKLLVDLDRSANVNKDSRKASGRTIRN